MKYIELKNIIIKGNRCEYEFDYPEEFEPYIADNSQNLFFELPESLDLQSVPESILTVPFVGAMYCATILTGIGIKVPVLDKAFYESIPRIEAAFKKIYPYTNYSSSVIVGKLVNNSNRSDTTKTSVFFTGGVDATSALVGTIDEKPTLINILGGDILISDTDSRDALVKYMTELTQQIGNEFVMMKSNCRRFFNEQQLQLRLNATLRPEHNHGWWASIGHILSMVSTIAPVLYCRNITKHYIGSGYSTKANTYDANSPDMVEAIKIADCNFISSDPDLDRNEKIKKIADFCGSKGLKVKLKVCWHRKASENCCHCEKCYRTIAAIIGNHQDPNNYGFKFEEEDYKTMHHFLKYNEVSPGFWQPNQELFQRNAEYWCKDKNMSWILNIKFNDYRRLYFKRYFDKIIEFCRRSKRKIWRLFNLS